MDMVMDMEPWRAAVHGVAKNQTWLSDKLNWIFKNSTQVVYMGEGLRIPMGVKFVI